MIDEPGVAAVERETACYCHADVLLEIANS
jgi:hypothetical protein